MISIDEEALTCDLAETYNIYDMRSLSPLRIATFSIGLRENSRIKLKLLNQSVDMQSILLAAIADRLSILIWMRSKDAEHGFNKPESIVDKLLNTNVEKDIQAFDSPEEFEAYMKQIQDKLEET